MRPLLRIGLPLAALLALGLWVLGQQAAPKSALQALPEWPQIDVQRVAAIEILQGDNRQLAIRKKNTAWFVGTDGEETRADDGAVRHLLEDLAHMHPVRVVSHQPAHFSRLGVADDASRVRLLDGQQTLLLDLLIGKPATDLVSTYVRLAGTSRAVTVNRSLTWQVRRIPDAWRMRDEKKTQAGKSAAEPAGKAP